MGALLAASLKLWRPILGCRRVAGTVAFFGHAVTISPYGAPEAFQINLPSSKAAVQGSFRCARSLACENKKRTRDQQK
jgi:hypothetical protein